MSTFLLNDAKKTKKKKTILWQEFHPAPQILRESIQTIPRVFLRLFFVSNINSQATTEENKRNAWFMRQHFFFLPGRFKRACSGEKGDEDDKLFYTAKME